MKTKIFLLLILSSAFLIGQDGVLVHGWLNTGSVWNGTGVKSVLQNEYDFDRILQPTIGGTSGTYSASQQSLNLRDYLINNNVTNSVAISYSMGGMNTRYHLKRQFEQGQSGRVQYHFTIGSPHIGAMLANNSAAAIQRIIITCEAALHPGGWLSETIEGIGIHYAYVEAANYAGVLFASEYFYQLVYDLGGPALNDLKMGSNADLYINHTNTNYENDIIKVGIAGIEDYPQVYRTAASGFGISETLMLNTVDAVKNYKYLVSIADFINFAEYPTPQNLAYLEESLGTLSIVLEFPKTWNLLVTGSTSGESDGVVQKTSQIYPNYNRQYYANHTNHAEELNHIEVLNRLREGLNFYGITTHPSLSVSISGPSTAPCATGSWTANVSGGYSPYSYQWYHMFTSGGGELAKPNTTEGGITPNKPINTWYPVGTNSPTLNYYLCGGDSYLRVDVTDSHNGTASATYYVAGSGIILPKSENTTEATKEYKTELLANHPNPFNPSTRISYSLQNEGRVGLKIYNTLGQEVKTLVDEVKTAGIYEAEFNASELPSGIYIYRMQAGEYVSTKKMLLIK